MTVLRHYQIHGLGVRLEAEDESWGDAVNEILGAYRRPHAGPDPLRIQLRGIDAERRAPGALDERGRFGGLRFYRDESTRKTWIEVHGRGWVEADPWAGTLRADLDYHPREDDWFVAHHAFYPAFLELLKARGLFPVHAGLVAHGEAGMLICGSSGSGKTTLTLSLATQGWSFLADDTCFLRAADAGIEGLAFWEDLHVTTETLERFASLAFLGEQSPRRENWKRHFAVDQLSALDLQERCRPRWIVFPRVRPGERSELRPLSSHDALLRLMPQSVIAVDPVLTELHLERLGSLVAQTQAFELAMGGDLDEVRARLEAGLEEAEA